MKSIILVLCCLGWAFDYSEIFIPETFRKREKFDASTATETAKRNYKQSELVINDINNSNEKEKKYDTKRTFNPIRPI